MDLSIFFQDHPRAALAFSGGVDSSYLLYAALQCGADVCAYYVKSAFQPAFELEDARHLASQLSAPLKILSLDILSCSRIAQNPPDRCYYCKQQIFAAIAQAAASDGYSLLLDGTNASDQEDDRPGMRALREMKVRSPLRECGLTKPEIRRLSREAGLFTWDKPAYACLATRVSSGEAITPDKLAATEKAENYLFSLGFHNFRVRQKDGCAHVQLPASQMIQAIEQREMILSELKKYYASALLDLEARA